MMVADPSPVALETFTDELAMQGLLQAQLPGFDSGELRLQGLRVCQARRNTSRKRNPCALTVCYELNVLHAPSGRCGRQLLYGQVYRPGAELPQGPWLQCGSFDEPPALQTPAFGEPLVFLPSLSLLLWALPNDPGLPQLAVLLDPMRVRPNLPGAAGCDVKVELLHYEPQQRATLRYTLSKAEPAAERAPRSFAPPPRVVYAKTFCDERAAHIHQRFSHFWLEAQSNPQAALVAQPLGFDTGLRTLWQAPARGLPLRSALTRSQGASLMASVAQALAQLHATPLEPDAQTAVRSAAHWVAQAQRRAQKLGRVNARWGERAQRIANALAADVGRQSLRPLSLIHGDFHPEQLWLHQGRVVLFDFDEFAWGDPMEDLAEFVLKLDAAGPESALSRALVQAYAAAAPQRFCSASLRWHRAVQSLLQASRAFIYQKPGWMQTLEMRLETSEQLANTLQAQSPP